MRFDVLVVEDESSLLRAIVRGLAEDPTLAVQGVGDVESALEVLERTPPDLVLTDLRLPGRSGIDLIAELEGRFPGVTVVVMTAERASFREELARRTGLLILEKPVPLEALRRVVRERLQAWGSADRRTGPFGILEYLQLASLGHHSLRIEGELAEGIQVVLEVVEGDLWNVTAGTSQGSEALDLLLELETLSVRFDRLLGRPATRQLAGSTEGLLLAASARRDENRRRSTGRRPPQSTAGATLDGACRSIHEGLPGARACGALALPSRELIAYSGPQESHHAALGGPSLFALVDLFEVASSPRPSLPGETHEEAHLLTAVGQIFCHRLLGSDIMLALATDAEARPGLAWLALRDIDGRPFGPVAPTVPEDGTREKDDREPAPLYTWETEHRACAWLVAATPAATWCGVIDPYRLAISAYSGALPEEIELCQGRVLRALTRLVAAAAAPSGAAIAAAAEELWVHLPEAGWFVRRLEATGRYLALATRPEAKPGPVWLHLRKEAETLVGELV